MYCSLFVMLCNELKQVKAKCNGYSNHPYFHGDWIDCRGASPSVLHL